MKRLKMTRLSGISTKSKNKKRINKITQLYSAILRPTEKINKLFRLRQPPDKACRLRVAKKLGLPVVLPPGLGDAGEVALLQAVEDRQGRQGDRAPQAVSRRAQGAQEALDAPEVRLVHASWLNQIQDHLVHLYRA